MAMNDGFNLPTIRFQGYSGKWCFKEIHKLISEESLYPPQDGNHGEIHPKKSDYVAYGIPFIMANNIRDGIVDYRNCSHITQEQAENLQKGFARAGDVLLTHKGTVGEVAIVHDSEFPFIMLTPQVTFYRISNSKKLDVNFLAFSFSTANFQNSIKEVSGGGTRAYIGITQQRNLKIAIPPERLEQTQIGTYFKALDRMIELHQRKHNKLVTLKQAMLQKMFPQEGATTPEIRFKGFSGDWVEVSVSEICTETSGGGTPRTTDDTFWNGNIPWIQSSDLVGSKLYGVTPKKWINTLALRRSATKLISKHSIAVVTRVGVGKLALINFDYATSQDFLSLSKLKVDNFFAVIALSVLLQSKLHETQGTAIKGLTKEELLAFSFSIPDRKREQQKIGTYFRNLDELIAKHTTQLQKLKQIKSACLEKMFV